jgi:protein involved in ribonucleotide reduction
MQSLRVAPLQPRALWAARHTAFTFAYCGAGNGAGKRYLVPLLAEYLAS